jgi:hypothetical protein
VPTIVISICLCVDLSMLVLYPFSPHKKRMMWYGLLALFLSVISAVLSMEEIEIDPKDRKFYPYFVSAECLLLGVAAVFSSFVAGIRLYQSGVSASIRRLIFVRHILFIFTFILCNVYFFL